MLTPVSIARSGFIASGQVGWPHHASGAVRSGHAANASITSGNVSSGQIGHFHISSGAITSGQLGTTTDPDGTKFLRDDFTWQPAGASLTSGAVGSGYLASGAVQGFFGATRHIASGTVGVFDFGSGAVVVGTIGSGAVVSGNIASGQVGRYALGSGVAASGTIVSGAIISGNIGIGAPDATKFLDGTLNWSTPGAASVGSGDIGSGKVASGTIQGFFGTTRHIASGTVGVFDFGSGAVIAGSVGSGAVVSGNIASGQVGTSHIADGGVTSGDIASGQVQWAHLASGALADRSYSVTSIVSGLSHITSRITAERISGIRAVFIDQSGALQIAMASISGRMPSVGVVVDNVASGIAVDVLQFGESFVTSGLIDFSGYQGHPLYVGRSGQLFPITTAGLLSGDIVQQVAFGLDCASGATSGGILVSLAGQSLSGGPPVLQSGAVGSGAVASGSVQGFFGTVRNIASGTVGVFDFGSGAVIAGAVGSGAVVSGNVASGQIGTAHIADGGVTSGDVASGQLSRFHLASGSVQGLVTAFNVASGTFNGFELGSGAIVSGRIASGQVGDGHIASGQIQGLVTKFSIGSGTFNGFELGSGAIVSGRIASGQIGDGHLASGQVQGLVTKFTIGSGTFTGFELGSGAIVSGRIASGQVGRYHLASGSVGSGLIVSGAISSGNIGFGTPDATKFLDGTLQWTSPGAASVNSGDISQAKLASGVIVRNVGSFFSGYNPFGSGMTEERISGVRAVCVSQSGNIRIAMASVSGRMPAIGVVVGNVESGIQCDVLQCTTFVPTSGMIELSGYGSQLLFVGRSGQVVTQSGSYNSGGLLSGDIVQPIGYALQSFSGVGNPQVVQITAAALPPFIPSLVYSGNIASGNVSQFHLASGAVHGLVDGFQVASGTFNGFELGSGAIVSGRIASGQIGDAHIASGQIQGLVTKFTVGSGTFNGFELGSGAIVSGRIASGQVGTAHIADGGVTSGDIASGNVQWAHLASGATITNSQDSTPIWSGGGTVDGFEFTAITSERISGMKAVCVDKSMSGLSVRIAMAGLPSSGRLPAIGIVMDNVESGIRCNVITGGAVNFGSGYMGSGFIMGRRLWVGRSGDPIVISGGYGSGGFLSGDIAQCLGVLKYVASGRTSGTFLINIDPTLFVALSGLLVNGVNATLATYSFGM